MSRFHPAQLADQAVTALDHAAARLQLAVGERRGCLVTLCLHHLFADEAEIQAARHMCQERMTVAGLRAMLTEFLRVGYGFASPADILAGLDPARRFLLLTFDDGFADNARVVPLLDEFGASAVIFVSVNHVFGQKSFWYDALYRRRLEQGVAPAPALAEMWGLAQQYRDRAEARAIELLGDSGLGIQPDTSRPLLPEELRTLAAHPRIWIGNHTCDHLPLTACSDEVARREMAEAQTRLAAVTGKTPLAIAYPYGDFDARIGRLAAEVGLQLGFTTHPRKTYRADLRSAAGRLALGRFAPHGAQPLTSQCRYFRSDVLLHARYREAKTALRRWLKRGPSA